MWQQLSVVTLLVCVCSGAELPTSTLKCKVNDDGCVIKAANALLQKGVEEHKKLELPVIDPLFIEKMDIAQGGADQAVTIDLKFRKVFLHGLKNAEIYKIHGFEENPDKNKIEIRFKTKLGTIKGPYQINGKMIVLPIQGKGNITLDLKDLDVHLRFLTKKIERNGKVYTHIEKSKFTYDVTGANVNFTNLFNGDKELGDNMNLFLNANWRILLDELNKPISTSFSHVFKNMFNDVFDKTPYNEMFDI